MTPIQQKNIEFSGGMYKNRQAIVEYANGIIKQQSGFYYFTKKRIFHASADVGLMIVAYKLRQLINIIDNTPFKSFSFVISPFKHGF